MASSLSTFGRFSARALLRSRVPASATRFQAVRAFGNIQPKEVHCEGAADGTVPTALNQTAGRAYEEYVMAEQGLNRFNDGPLIGPFGTQDKPVMILSAYESRTVGCVGGNSPEHEHDVNWMKLRNTRKTICCLCGQFFQLYSNPGEGEIKPEEIVEQHLNKDERDY